MKDYFAMVLGVCIIIGALALPIIPILGIWNVGSGLVLVKLFMTDLGLLVFFALLFGMVTHED